MQADDPTSSETIRRLWVLACPCFRFRSHLLATRSSWAHEASSFSAALAVQIFGPTQRATIMSLSIELLIIILVMDIRMMRLFSQMDEDASREKNSSPTGSQCDVEHGSESSSKTADRNVCTHSPALN